MDFETFLFCCDIDLLTCIVFPQDAFYRWTLWQYMHILHS
jgi:hypothetical protein